MTEVILRYREARTGEKGLFPVDDEGIETFRALKLNRDIGCEVIQRRNPRHHRLFFAMLNFVKLHCDTFEHVPIDRIKDALKLATGLADTFVDAKTGKPYFVLKSISFAAMDQTSFNKFFDAATEVIANRYMPAGTTPESVCRELIEMVDGPHAVERKTA